MNTTPQWYVMDWAPNGQDRDEEWATRWFGDDEATARTYLLLLKCAFGKRIHIFLGRDVPPLHIAGPASAEKAT